MKHFEDEYSSNIVSNFTFFPDKIDQALTETKQMYNAVLSIPSLTECSQLVTCLDTQSIVGY
jgi:hypothetical protein